MSSTSLFFQSSEFFTTNTSKQIPPLYFFFRLDMLNEGVEVEVVKYVPVQLSVEVKQVVADLVNKQKKSGLKVGRATKINYR